MSDVPLVQDLGGAILIDARHLGMKGSIGSYLLAADDGAFILIETGPMSTMANVEEGIRAAGYEPQRVAAVLVTHIHLDHAGAAAGFAEKYGAPVYVHEEGAPHLIDPSRLVKSARRAYGDQLEALWGQVRPVPQERVRPVADGAELVLVGRNISVMHTPGHASSHVSYFLDGRDLFTGDAAGIKVPGSSFVKPATAPPEIDLDIWEATFGRIRDVAPKRLLLSHFGAVGDVEGHLRELSGRNRQWAQLVLEGLKANEDDQGLVDRIAAAAEALLDSEDADAAARERSRVTSSYELTALGLKRYWLKHRPEALAARAD